MKREWIESFLKEIESVNEADSGSDDRNLEEFQNLLSEQWAIAIGECSATSDFVTEFASTDFTKSLEQRLSDTIKHGIAIRNASLEAKSCLKAAKNHFGLALVSLCESLDRVNELDAWYWKEIRTSSSPQEVGLQCLVDVHKNCALPTYLFFSLVTCSLENLITVKRNQLVNEGIPRTSSKISQEDRRLQAQEVADRLLKSDREKSMKFLAELTYSIAKHK